MAKWNFCVLQPSSLSVFATGLAMSLTTDWATGGSSVKSRPTVGFVNKVADLSQPTPACNLHVARQFWYEKSEFHDSRLASSPRWPIGLVLPHLKEPCDRSDRNLCLQREIKHTICGSSESNWIRCAPFVVCFYPGMG